MTPVLYAKQESISRFAGLGQPVPSPARAGGQGPANVSLDDHRSVHLADRSFALQVRMPSQLSLIAGLIASPSFAAGYRSGPNLIAAGLGVTRFAYGESGDDVSLLLFQFMPSIQHDLWRSRDGRARATVTAGLGTGRFTAVDSSSPTFPSGPGAPPSPAIRQSRATALLIPFQLTFGGDYYLSRHLPLGADVGLQSAFLTNAKTDGLSEDVHANMNLFYGGLRATLLLGD